MTSQPHESAGREQGRWTVIVDISTARRGIDNPDRYVLSEGQTVVDERNKAVAFYLRMLADELDAGTIDLEPDPGASL